MPASAPMSIGRATDQPIKPNMPRPNPRLRLPRRCILSLRAALEPIARLNAVGRLVLTLSFTLDLQEPADKPSLFGLSFQGVDCLLWCTLPFIHLICLPRGRNKPIPC